jgi:hypothetical protein
VTEQSVGDVVLAMADNDPDLPDRAKLLILAALDGDEALAAELDQASTRTQPAVRSESNTQPVRAYLTSIEVNGFRGIGAKATLPLAAESGLIIVAGRNGSGKSSFAEAAELALTGRSYRWADRPVQWMSAWRNLHQPDPCAIRIGLAEEGSGTTTIGVDWAPDADLGNRTVWTQRAHGKREPGIGALGWDTAMDLYRPILSYEELGRLLDGKPKDLYEAMERILGLGQVNEATRRLAEQLRRLQGPEAAATKLKATLRAALEALDDSRAIDALQQLRKHKHDLDLISGIAAGTGAAATDLVALRELTTLAAPGEDAVRAVARSLRDAVGALAEHSGTAIALAGQTAALLRQAIDLRHEHGTQPCPVCGHGVLDEGWLATAITRAAEAETRMQKLTDARAAAVKARVDAHRLVSSVPRLPNVELTTLAAARIARDVWTDVPDGDLGLAEHIERHHTDLLTAFDELRVEANDVLKQREDTWTPVAEQLSRWVGLKREAAEHQADTDDVAAASKWITDNAGVAALGMYAPANIAWRALARLAAGSPLVTPSGHWLASARLAAGLRTLFRRNESIALLDRLYPDDPYWHKVLQYCAAGDLQSTMDEYLQHLCAHETGSTVDDDSLSQVADTALAALTLRAPTYHAFDPDDPADQRIGFTSRFALRYASQATGVDSARPTEIREAFNSPFWPFVLATTSAGQEGIDFHWWSHAVVHWNVPTNPVDFEQREGRVHRYGGHAIRKNIAARHRDAILAADDVHPWRAAFRIAGEHADQLGDFAPYWLYPGDAKIERHLLPYALSQDIPKSERLKRGLALYRLAFGQPRQEDFLAMVDRHGTALHQPMIDLRPPM